MKKAVLTIADLVKLFGDLSKHEDMFRLKEFTHITIVSGNAEGSVEIRVADATIMSSSGGWKKDGVCLNRTMRKVLGEYEGNKRSVVTLSTARYEQLLAKEKCLEGWWMREIDKGCTKNRNGGIHNANN